MRSNILLLLILLTSCLVAQEVPTAKLVTASVGKQYGEAVEVQIYRAEEKDILKEWKSILKGYDGEVSSKNGNVESLNTTIAGVSENPVNVYAEIKSGPNNSLIFTALFMEGSMNVSASESAKTLVENMAKELTKEATSDHHGAQEKALLALEREMKNLKRDREKAQKAIEDCKESIKDNEYKIRQNEKDRAALEQKIEAQRKIVENAKNEAEIHR